VAGNDSGDWRETGKEMLTGYHPGAVARLAQATAVVIATLLAIPDAVALLPGAASPLSWALRVVSVWLSALVLWFAGYFCVMHLLLWFSQGVSTSREGIKLWRFGRRIPWASVAAVSVEPELLFSRLFAIKPPAGRLTLYVRRREGGRLAPQSIPSILFERGQFENLARVVSRAASGIDGRADAVLFACPADLPAVKRAYGFTRWARALLSVAIALGLISYLARRATVNYLYNAANKEFSHGRYAVARRQYRMVTSIDPFFAVAWQNLGGAEFQLGDRPSAVRDWQKALAIKPDFVEPKVGLAYIYMHDRQYDRARNLLERALRVAPRNTEVLTNLADLEMRVGQTRAAVNTARLALTLDPGNRLAACLIAQGRLRQGKPEQALTQLLTAGRRDGAGSPLPYCLEVEGEARLALGQLDQAAALFQKVLAITPADPGCLVSFAEVERRRGRWGEAGSLLDRARQIAPRDPGPWLALGELALKRGDRAGAASYWRRAVALPGQDALSLAAAANLGLALGKTEAALALAERSIRIEPMTPLAVSVIDRLNPTR